MARMTEPDRTLRGEQLGEELRRLREQAKLNLNDAAQRIGASASKLSRIETALIGVRVEDVAGLLAIYGVVGRQRDELFDLAREAGQRGWWQHGDSQQRTLSRLESRASAIINIEPRLIPGMLQTIPYATAVSTEVGQSDPDIAADNLAERLQRQAILRRTKAPTFEAIIDQAALHTPIGGWITLTEQLTYLLEVACRPNITVRVIPELDHGHPGMYHAYYRYHLPGRTGIVYVEERTSGLFLESGAQVEHYDEVTRELRQLALGEQDSLALIASYASKEGR
jgi:transcriptional regulator with XRE-family HTH domain